MYTKDDFRKILNAMFDQYPNTRFNMPFVLSHILQELPGLGPTDYARTSIEVQDFLKEEAANGSISILKGKGGGLSRSSNFTPTAASWEKAAAMVKPTPAEPTNDHVCPCCRNDRVSKSEKTCWKCGGSLH